MSTVVHGRAGRSPVGFTLIGILGVALFLQSCGGGTRQPDRDPAGGDSGGEAQYSGVWTYHYDNSRSGAHTTESTLTPANVNPNRFGKKFTRQVQGFVYAQPLYIENVEVSGKGRFDVIYVATEHNQVYAFDASGQVKEPLWHRSLIDPAKGITTMARADVQSGNTGPEVGITGTPVIDRVTGTMYLVAATKENGKFYQRLHALDIRSGEPRANSPAEIRASIPGRGDGNDGNGNIVFNPLRQNQRGALALANNTVYITWGSHHIIDPWHGWVMAYTADTLQQVAAFATTPDSRRAGIWMSGNGPLIDGDGNLYVASGQGVFTAAAGGRDYGNSVIKLSRGSDGLGVQDYFTPFDQATMYSRDLDMGTGGPVLLPEHNGRRFLLIASKAGNIYILDRANLGKHKTTDDQNAVQVVRRAVGVLPSGDDFAGRGAAYGTPAVWNQRIYFSGAYDYVKAFSFTNGQLSTSPVSMGIHRLERRGATPVISAQGTQNGIVWLVDYRGGSPASLQAYDAMDLKRFLYSSNMNGARDALNRGTKFAAPVVYKGKVIVGSENRITVYGLLN